MFEYEIDLDHHRRIVRMILKGEYTLEDGEQLISDARLRAAQTGYAIMYDTRLSCASNISESDWYYIAKMIASSESTRTRVTPVAILASPDADLSGYRYYVNLSARQGLTVNLFTDAGTAFDWLAHRRHSA